MYQAIVADKKTGELRTFFGYSPRMSAMIASLEHEYDVKAIYQLKGTAVLIQDTYPTEWDVFEDVIGRLSEEVQDLWQHDRSMENKNRLYHNLTGYFKGMLDMWATRHDEGSVSSDAYSYSSMAVRHILDAADDCLDGTEDNEGRFIIRVNTFASWLKEKICKE